MAMSVIERASREANPEMWRNNPKLAGEAARPKRDAGRPLAFSGSQMGEAMRRWPDVKVRTIHERIYGERAIKALCPGGAADPQFAWLVNADGTARRASLVAELGRVKDAAEIRRCAAWLCEKKPRAHVGVAQLRLWRLGDCAKAATKGELAARLIDTLNQYAAARANCSPKLMRRAIEAVMEGIELCDARLRERQDQ